MDFVESPESHTGEDTPSETEEIPPIPNAPKKAVNHQTKKKMPAAPRVSAPTLPSSDNESVVDFLAPVETSANGAARKSRKRANSSASGEPARKRRPPPPRRRPASGFKAVPAATYQLAIRACWAERANGNDIQMFALRDESNKPTRDSVVMANINFAGGVQTAWMMDFKNVTVQAIMMEMDKYVRVGSFEIPNVPSAEICPYMDNIDSRVIDISAKGNSTLFRDVTFTEYDSTTVDD